ncbi:MAG: hypothetical protein R6U21_03065 [Thermoplasmatota archaeon]
MQQRTQTKILTIFILIMLITLPFFLFQIPATTNDNNTTCENQSQIGDGNNQGRDSRFMQGYTTWIILLIIIIIITIISYILINRNMKKQMQKNAMLIQEMLQSSPQPTQQHNDTSLKNNQSEPIQREQYQKSLLRFLNYNENRVMKKLLEYNGTVLQSEISRMPNMGKVKASRTLRDMKTKKIITVESYGKTNKIHLSEELQSIFLKEQAN